MNFWESFALYQLSAGLNMVITRFGKKYLTPEEMGAAMLLIAAVASLPERIHSGTAAALEPPHPQMFLKQ